MASKHTSFTPFRLISPGGSRGKLNIFIFHRILAEPDPVFPADADTGRFETFLRFARTWLNVLPLEEAAARLKAGTLPPAAASITFDDGYADNLTIAAPMLKRHELPATVFVATDFVDGGRMWNDWVVEGIRRTTLDEVDLRDLDLPKVSVRTPEERRSVIETLLMRVKYLPFARRLSACEGIMRRCKVPTPPSLMLNRSQVVQLPRFGVSVGAHTHTHPILANEPGNYCREDIARSKLLLEDWLQAPVTTFAYPNGTPGTDYRHEHVEMVRELGFSCAVTTSVGYASRSSDVHQLPRFTPWGRSVSAVAVRLGRHLAAPPSTETVGVRP